MNRSPSAIGRRTSIVVLGVVLVALVGGTALAGHITGNVKSYTGCLASGDGVIVKVKEGDLPKSACASGQTQVHLSGGDITRVSVVSGGGLTGGGANGEVTISLDPKYALPQSCSTDEVPKWNGSAWVCRADNDTTYTLTCPANHIYYVGVCIETVNRVDMSHADAVSSCAAYGKRLPTPGELWAFRAKAGVTLATSEWTDDVADATTGAQISIVGNTTSYGFGDAASRLAPFRCVTGPVIG